MEASSLPIHPGPTGRAASPRQEPQRDRELIDRWCERGILGLVLAILTYGPLAFGATDVFPVLVIQALVMGVLLLWIVRIWLGKPYRVLWPPVCWAVVGFMIYAVIRYRMALEEHA